LVSASGTLAIKPFLISGSEPTASVSLGVGCHVHALPLIYFVQERLQGVFQLSYFKTISRTF